MQANPEQYEFLLDMGAAKDVFDKIETEFNKSIKKDAKR